VADAMSSVTRHAALPEVRIVHRQRCRTFVANSPLFTAYTVLYGVGWYAGVDGRAVAPEEVVAPLRLEADPSQISFTKEIGGKLNTAVYPS
jgi:hypothetical protein